jgi:hypothetical protein
VTLDDGTKELDRLFSRVEQSPWRERSGAFRVPNEGTDFADPIGLPDMYQQSPSLNGFLNGGLESGPPDEDSIIDDEDNDLPDWDYVEVAGTWQVNWAADANAPFGYSLSFTQAAASASDEVYFEQIIPIAQYRRFVTTVMHSADNSNMGMKVAVQFLDETEATVGSELTNTWSITTQQVSRFWREPPALAVYARVRIGVVNAAGTTGQTATILFITSEEPTTYSVQITGVYSFLSPAISTDYAMPFPSDLIPNGVYVAPLRGFVLATSIKTDDTISAGTITAQAENDTQATNPGPTVALSSAASVGQTVQSLDGLASYHFDPGDELHLELSCDGSVASTGSADYYGTLTLLLVVNDEGDW